AAGAAGEDRYSRRMTLERLDAAALEAGLSKLPDWSRSGESIHRTYAFKDFLESMAFVNRVAARAEEVQHHPDLLIRWNKVTLTLSTHDANGLTEKDLAMAADCDRFAAG
ncbi:MAG: 4a-hydroxytetrahydrobiopterin dehydratase, partial [Phycisphaerales bacterium]